jgi:hypothetical protein
VLAGGTFGEMIESLRGENTLHHVVGMELILRMAFLPSWKIIFPYLPPVRRLCEGFWHAKGRILTGNILNTLSVFVKFHPAV